MSYWCEILHFNFTRLNFDMRLYGGCWTISLVSYCLTENRKTMKKKTLTDSNFLGRLPLLFTF